LRNQSLASDIFSLLRVLLEKFIWKIIRNLFLEVLFVENRKLVFSYSENGLEISINQFD